MNRIVSLRSLAIVFVSALAFGSAACSSNGADVDTSEDIARTVQASTTDITAPTPDPSVVKCITNSGEHQVTVDQCKQLLRIAGCEPGAVVNDTMKCSTTSTEDPTSDGPDDIAAPPRDPSVVTCITNTGEHQVTVDQCKQLLTIAGCKPGAVVNDTMKCSTT